MASIPQVDEFWSLIPPVLARLVTRDDWQVAGDYWEEHGDDHRAQLCRQTLFVGGPQHGKCFSVADTNHLQVEGYAYSKVWYRFGDAMKIAFFMLIDIDRKDYDPIADALRKFLDDA